MQQFNNEVLIARALITTEKSIALSSRYHRLFQATYIPAGRTLVRFPIKDHELSSDLTDFQRDFPHVKVDITSNAIEEY